eukprot:jgi/Hompol1/10/HPOL_001306-RA
MLREGSEQDTEFLQLPPVCVETRFAVAASPLDPEPASQSALLAVSSRRGFVVLPASSNEFAFVRSGPLIKAMRESSPRQILKADATVALPTIITLPDTMRAKPLSFIRLSADELSIIAVCESTLAVFDVATIAAVAPGKSSIAPIASVNIEGGDILDMRPNPEFLPSAVAVLSSDNRVRIVHLDGNIVVLPTTDVTAICWSRKGKQIACGTRSGHVVKATPAGEIKKDDKPPPTSDVAGFIIKELVWLDDRVVLAIFSSVPSEPDSPADTAVYVFHQDANKQPLYTRLEDPVADFSAPRPAKYHIDFLSNWGDHARFLVAVTNAASNTVGFIGYTASDEWIKWNLAEKYVMDLPLDSNDQDTWPIGLAFLTSSTDSLPPPSPGEPQIAPMPILLVLNNLGQVLAYDCINSLSGGYPGMIKTLEPIPAASAPSATVKSARPSDSKPASTPAPLVSKPSAPASTGFGFGVSSTAAPTGTGLFGSGLKNTDKDAATASPMFGAPTAFGVSSSFPASAKSGASTGGSVFGGAMASQKPSLAPAGPFSFGAKPATDGSSLAFGSTSAGGKPLLSESIKSSDKLATVTAKPSVATAKESEPSKAATAAPALASAQRSQPSQPVTEKPKQDIPAQTLGTAAASNQAAASSKPPRPTVAQQDALREHAALVARFDEMYLDLEQDFEQASQSQLREISENLKTTRAQTMRPSTSSALSSLGVGDTAYIASTSTELADRLLTARCEIENLVTLKDKFIATLLHMQTKKEDCATRLGAIQNPEQSWTLKAHDLGPEMAALKTKLTVQKNRVDAWIANINRIVASMRADIERRDKMRRDHAKSTDWQMICTIVTQITKSSLAASRRVDMLLREYSNLGHKIPSMHSATAILLEKQARVERSDSPRHGRNGRFGLDDIELEADDSVLHPIDPQLGTAPAEDLISKGKQASELSRVIRGKLRAALTRADRVVPVTTSKTGHSAVNELLKRPLPPRPAKPTILSAKQPPAEPTESDPSMPPLISRTPSPSPAPAPVRPAKSQLEPESVRPQPASLPQFAVPFAAIPSVSGGEGKSSLVDGSGSRIPVPKQEAVPLTFSQKPTGSITAVPFQPPSFAATKPAFEQSNTLLAGKVATTQFSFAGITAAQEVSKPSVMPDTMTSAISAPTFSFAGTAAKSDDDNTTKPAATAQSKPLFAPASFGATATAAPAFSSFGAFGAAAPVASFATVASSGVTTQPAFSFLSKPTQQNVQVGLDVEEKHQQDEEDEGEEEEEEEEQLEQAQEDEDDAEYDSYLNDSPKDKPQVREDGNDDGADDQQNEDDSEWTQDD